MCGTGKVLALFPHLAKGIKSAQRYISDPLTLSMVEKACGDLKEKTVIELGAGPGLLTRSLLQSGVRHLVTFEESEIFSPNLKKIGEGAENFTFLPANMTSIFKEQNYVFYSQILLDSLLQKSSFGPGLQMLFVGVTPTNSQKSFWPTLVAKSLLENHFLFSHGRPDCLLFTDRAAEMVLDPLNEDKRLGISWVANILWDIEVVGSTTALLPPCEPARTLIKMKRTAINLTKDEKIYLRMLAKQLAIKYASTLDVAMKRCGPGADKLLEIVDLDPKRTVGTLTSAEVLKIAQAFAVWEHRPTIVAED